MGIGEGLYVGLGTLVRARRERKGMTQSQLADRIGMTRTSITNIEKGRQKVQLHTLYDIAIALDALPAELLPSAEKMEPGAIDVQLPEDAKPEERDWALRVLTRNAR
jgi:transcriptional regulator with XRE-family HTH domain